MKSDNKKPIVAYFKGVRAEWSKITWPEKMQVQGETFIVLIIVFVFTLAVYIMDIFFKWILGLIH